MFRFIISRLGQGIWVIWGIITLLFAIFFVLGDPVNYLTAESADEKTREVIRQTYGLDQPLVTQYLHYLNRLLPIGTVESTQTAAHFPLFGDIAIKVPDFGTSFQTGQPVGTLISQHLEGTAFLGLTALGFAALLGILLGTFAALWKDKWPDRLILTVSVLGISAPSFFVGVLIAWLFAVKWQDITGLQVTGYLFEDHIFSPGRTVIWKNLLLPALALGIRPLAVITQLTRSSMIEVLSMDYIRTARSKGLSGRRVIGKHGLRNGMNPVITSVTGWLASLLAGAFFIEYIFNWQGLGKLTIDALNTKDFPLIIGCVSFIGTVFVLISILTDLLYGLLDPRVRIK
ncbi:MAG: ABC transporter permease [Bacteroidota bacterium]